VGRVGRVVGYGDVSKPLAGLKVTGETAQATSGEVTMLFRRVSGCWPWTGGS